MIKGRILFGKSLCQLQRKLYKNLGYWEKFKEAAELRQTAGQVCLNPQIN